ncbi:imidazole glycerol phosphate synthase subunit HisH [Candidatus Pacearchaeota archaeon CG1_02_32_132]|nr:MAG: imidazole glycerol phosphate synthase subunit HisH [Candidatus Pacearchaeota archaeon CG1_02_32_132]
MITVINCGTSNLRSVEKALVKLGAEFIVSDKKEDIESASHLILPGVGAFGETMKNLHNLGLVECIRKEVLEKKKPILGICLGMQLLFSTGEEGGINNGIGLVRGVVKKFDLNPGKRIKIPHIGWNDILGDEIRDIEILKEINEGTNFYFVHSYHAVSDEKMKKAFTNYGYDFISVFQKGNIFGTQFHPEKSQTEGLKIIKNFISYNA